MATSFPDNKKRLKISVVLFHDEFGAENGDWVMSNYFAKLLGYVVAPILPFKSSYRQTVLTLFDELCKIEGLLEWKKLLETSGFSTRRVPARGGETRAAIRTDMARWSTFPKQSSL
jgi:hypothetical protein